MVGVLRLELRDTEVSRILSPLCLPISPYALMNKPFSKYDFITDLKYGTDSEKNIAYYKTIIETLQEIIDNLKWRHQTIGNMIKWRQFESGS